MTDEKQPVEAGAKPPVDSPIPPADEPGPASRSTRGERAARYLREEWPWLLVVGAIMLGATLLRFWALGRQGMWFDELFSANATAYGPSVAIKITAQDTNPPLYYLLQSLLVPIFGRAEEAMRLLPAFLGVLTTGVMYLAGRKLFDRATGLWAASLFAVSAIALQYAQEARMYSLLMFFAALVLWAFALLVEEPTVTRAVFLGIAIAGLAYTHVYGYMTAPMLLIPALLVPRIRRRIGPHLVVTYGVAGLLFLPWVFVIPGQILAVRSQVLEGGWWMKAPVDIGGSIAEDFAAFSPGSAALPAAVFFALMLAGFAVRPAPSPRSDARDVGVVGSDPGVTEGDLLWVLLTLALLPMLAGLLISKYITPIATLRNTLVCLPAAYLLAVRGGLKLWRPVGVIALAGLLLFALLQVPSVYTENTKGAWRQATEEVTAQPKTGVLTQDWEGGFNLDTYAGIIGRSGDLHSLWVNSVDATPAAQGRAIDDTEEIGVPGFVWRWDRVYVVSPNADSSVAKVMDRLPGWTLSKTIDLGTPVLRLYTRVNATQ